ncbi:hypothetical protein AAMO2058_000654700 [Amorphochlora amoebiformis]
MHNAKQKKEVTPRSPTKLGKAVPRHLSRSPPADGPWRAVCGEGKAWERENHTFGGRRRHAQRRGNPASSRECHVSDTCFRPLLAILTKRGRYVHKNLQQSNRGPFLPVKGSLLQPLEKCVLVLQG